MYQRFRRWRGDNEVWERVLEALVGVPDFVWLMIDAGHAKVQLHGTGVAGSFPTTFSVIFPAFSSPNINLSYLLMSGKTASQTRRLLLWLTVLPSGTYWLVMVMTLIF